MLKGIDVSKWQNVGDYKDSRDLGHTDFMIVKATEGRTYTDPKFSQHIDYAKSNNMLLGAYHYARPDNGNDPEAEASNFVNALRSKNLIGNVLMALDWEAKSLSFSADWALRWLREVYRLTGVKPVIYMSSSNVKKFGVIASEDFGLWVANWTREPSSTMIAPWPVKALWQKRGAPLDLDIFYGDIATWKLYCRSALTDDTKNEDETENETGEVSECKFCEEVIRKCIEALTEHLEKHFRKE